MINRRLFFSLLPLLVSSAAHAGGASGFRALSSDHVHSPGTQHATDFSPANDSDVARIRSAVAQGRAEPLSKILAVVRSRYTGKVVGIRLEDGPNTLHYCIRILSPDAGLFDVHVDAGTARIIGETSVCES
ncbi:PepSY domain-containing protein [Aestuariivirga sp.]|uniref:PepSY domain-containing protein n=1 Tax=Aestuariivirga sp. TaxID=2650926 RepID=UPI003BABD068